MAGNIFQNPCPFSPRFCACLFVMTIKPTYPHIVCSLGFACAFAALAASAHAASDKNSGKSHRIAETQQETTITGTDGRQTTVKSATLFLTGPEARIRETPATTPAPAEKNAAAPFANVMASEEKDLAAKSLLEMGELLRSQDKPEAIVYFEKAGAGGNGYAYYWLGDIYQWGRFKEVEKNLPKALEYYHKAAAKNVQPALDSLARMYEEGEGVEKNLAKAAEYYRLCAECSVGCPGTQQAAQEKLAKIYAEIYAGGKGDPKNLAKAISYFEKQTCDYYPAAIFGDIYRTQAEAETDPAKAAALYAKAAKVYTHAIRDHREGDTVARYQLGRLYAAGKGVTADAAQSAQLIQEAAKLGYTPAKFEAEHPTAKSVAINPDQATVDMIQAAAEAGNPQAQYELGTILLSGTGAEKKAEEALKWYRLAAKQNNADAQYALGKMYAAGDGVKKSRDRAFEYFNMAAEQKHPEAAFEVAKATENENKAFELYTAAASGGVPGAQYALGNMFATGKSVPVDFAKASKYYQAAAEQGDLKSQLALLKMYFRIHHKTMLEDVGPLRSFPLPEPYEIFKYAQNAAEKSDPLGQYYLGLCYTEGIGVEIDPTKAMAALENASGSNKDVSTPMSSR